MSTDGQMMWWDTRRLGEPTDTLQLATDSKGGGMVLGGSSMEYNQEAGPTKYLVGTEQGIVLQVRKLALASLSAVCWHRGRVKTCTE